MRYHFIPVRMIFIKKPQKIQYVGEDAEKLEPLCIAGENVKWYTTVENSKVVSQKIKHRITIRLINSTSGTISKRNEDSLRDLWDNIKRNNIHIIGVPEGEEREKDPRKYLKRL